MAGNGSMLLILVLALKQTGKLASLVWYGRLCPGHTAGTSFWHTIPSWEEWSHHKAVLSWGARVWVWVGNTELSHITSGTVTAQECTPHASRHCWQVHTSHKGWESGLHGDRDTWRAQFCLLSCRCAEVPVKATADVLLLSPEPGAQWDLHRRVWHHEAIRHHWRRAHATELAVIFPLFCFSSLQVYMSVLCTGVYECSYLCGSICVCRCTHSYVRACSRLVLRVYLHCFSNLLIEATFLNQSNPELTDRASFQFALGSLCFYFLRLELTGDSLHPQHLYGFWRSERFSCLCKLCKCSNHWTIPPAFSVFCDWETKIGHDLIPKVHL